MSKLAGIDLDVARKPVPSLTAVVAFALGFALPVALRMSRQAIASGHMHARVHRSLRSGVGYGSLTAVTDSDQRSLRSISTTAREAAARTDDLLADLAVRPGVRVFHGVRTPSANLPVIPHAITAGRRLMLIESVAWPSGRYETMGDGRIACDSTYIGQTVRPFLSAVHQWRNIVPRGHIVTAIVVVHTCAGEEIRLPGRVAQDLAWVRAEDAIGHIRRRLSCSQQRVSASLLAALISAADDQHGSHRPSG